MATSRSPHAAWWGRTPQAYAHRQRRHRESAPQKREEMGPRKAQKGRNLGGCLPGRPRRSSISRRVAWWWCVWRRSHATQRGRRRAYAGLGLIRKRVSAHIKPGRSAHVTWPQPGLQTTSGPRYLGLNRIADVRDSKSIFPPSCSLRVSLPRQQEPPYKPSKGWSATVFAYSNRLLANKNLFMSKMFIYVHNNLKQML